MTTAADGDLATSFTMATLFSHGATQLLAGEAGRVLVDPYYVDNHVAEQLHARTVACVGTTSSSSTTSC